MKIISKLLVIALLALLSSATAAPLGTAFTYQGRLNDGSNAATGSYDLDFALFAVPDGGSPLGMSVTYSGLPVSNGLFTVTLDFGASPFAGDARWLQIQVRTNGGRTPPPYTLLSPRQPLTPTPYALYAPSAGSAVTASNVAPFSVTAGSIADGTITAGKLASGQVVKSVNGLFDVVTLSAGTNVTLTPSGNDLKISATPGTVVTNAGWGIVGNSGTTAANFLGTLDGQPLELRVNGQRALRLEPGAGGAPNVVGGSVSNRVAAGVIGATVAGGGNSLGGAHRIEADFGSIGGGYQNTIQTGATLAFIAGGYGNTIRTSAFDSSIGGGAANTIQSNAYLSAIGGGSDNSIQVNAQYATIAGGEQNTIQTGASRSTIGGGSVNLIQTNAQFATISGGSGNSIQPNAQYSAISGGYGNAIQFNATNSTIGGGSGNAIQTNAQYSTIAGGELNTIQTGAYRSTIGGGSNHRIGFNATNCVLGGGYGNTIDANAWNSTIGGGHGNQIQASALEATIGGGAANTIQSNAYLSAIGGGSDNLIQANAKYSTIAGGEQNTVETGAFRSTIGGGYGNSIQANAWFSTIGGGEDSSIQSGVWYGTIGGGTANAIEAYSGTIAGGSVNTIQDSGAHSFIGGGYGNLIAGMESSITGGTGNTIQGHANQSTISGGSGNTILSGAGGSAIAGGSENTIQGVPGGVAYSVIGGGSGNMAGPYCATVPGGTGNYAGGNYSFAAGLRAKALHDGTFVWADATYAEYASTGTDQFCIRATGGVQLSPATSLHCGTQTRQMLNLWSTNYGIGVQGNALYFRTGGDQTGNSFVWYRGGSHNDGYLNGGAGSLTLMALNAAGLTVNGTFVSSSDRDRKENFATVSPREVLDKVAALPISRWNFKGDATTPHVGPMAQDFHAAFGLGTDDKHIATVDADGVALAAIQGLNQKLTDELNRRDAESAELKKTLNELRETVVKLVNQRNGGAQ